MYIHTLAQVLTRTPTHPGASTFTCIIIQTAYTSQGYSFIHTHALARARAHVLNQPTTFFVLVIMYPYLHVACPALCSANLYVNIYPYLYIYSMWICSYICIYFYMNSVSVFSFTSVQWVRLVAIVVLQTGVKHSIVDAFYLILAISAIDLCCSQIV